MKKRIMALILTLALGLSLMTVSAFADQVFSDVSESAWYYSDVLHAVDLGLINGYPDGTFGPDKEITIAQVVKLAACMNQSCTQGSVTLENAQAPELWYASYVDYALQAGILDEPFAAEDYDRPATRLEYMNLFAKALPAEYYEEINAVLDDEIPDLASDMDGAEAVYLLYRAGIVQGGDAAHNSLWANNIKRSEVSAILTRMMDPAQRISFWIHEPQSEAEDIYDKDEDTQAVTPEPVEEQDDTLPEGDASTADPEPADQDQTSDNDTTENEAPVVNPGRDTNPASDDSGETFAATDQSSEDPGDDSPEDDTSATSYDGTYSGPMGAVLTINGDRVTISALGRSASGTLSGGVYFSGAYATVSVGDGYAIVSYAGGSNEAIENAADQYGSSFTFTKNG